MAPVRKEGLIVRSEEAPEIRRVLERGVEVDVVADREREIRRRLLERDDLCTARDELVDAGQRVLPRRPAKRQERVEAHGFEHRAEPDRSEIEDAVTYAEPDPRRVAVDRKDSEADPSRHNGSTPIPSSSSTGSKKLQLPIE